MVCWMNYEESELQPGNNRITRSKATTADLLVFESLLPRKKKLLNPACVHPLPPPHLDFFLREGGLYIGQLNHGDFIAKRTCQILMIQIRKKTRLGIHVQLTDTFVRRGTSTKWTPKVALWHPFMFFSTLYKKNTQSWSLLFFSHFL